MFIFTVHLFNQTYYKKISRVSVDLYEITMIQIDVDVVQNMKKLIKIDEKCSRMVNNVSTIINKFKKEVSTETIVKGLVNFVPVICTDSEENIPISARPVFGYMTNTIAAALGKFLKKGKENF